MNMMLGSYLITVYWTEFYKISYSLNLPRYDEYTCMRLPNMNCFLYLNAVSLLLSFPSPPPFFEKFRYYIHVLVYYFSHLSATNLVSIDSHYLFYNHIIWDVVLILSAYKMVFLQLWWFKNSISEWCRFDTQNLWKFVLKDDRWRH